MQGYVNLSYSPVMSATDDLVLYTAQEVADVLRMNLQVVQRKLQAGEIPGYRLGREWRVEKSQLLAWLETRSNQRPNRRDDPARFFAPDGRLRSLPAARAKRQAVLRKLVEAFAPARTYREREVNAVLRGYHDDVATIRRELVAEKLLVRTAAGVYKRAAPRDPALRRG